MRRKHPFTLGRTVLLAAALAALLTWLRVGDDEGDGAVILPLLALPAGAFLSYFVGLAINRQQGLPLLPGDVVARNVSLPSCGSPCRTMGVWEPAHRGGHREA